MVLELASYSTYQPWVEVSTLSLDLENEKFALLNCHLGCLVCHVDNNSNFYAINREGRTLNAQVPRNLRLQEAARQKILGYPVNDQVRVGEN